MLYIADNKWQDFYSEPGDRQGQADLIDLQHTIPSTVDKYAVSEKLFTQREFIEWRPAMEMWMDVRVVFVVVGGQPDDEPGPWRWKLEGTDAGTFFWDHEKRDFDFRHGVGIIDKVVDRRIGEAARANLSDQLQTYRRDRTVEILPATVARTL